MPICDRLYVVWKKRKHESPNLKSHGLKLKRKQSRPKENSDPLRTLFTVFVPCQSSNASPRHSRAERRACSIRSTVSNQTSMGQPMSSWTQQGPCSRLSPSCMSTVVSTNANGTCWWSTRFPWRCYLWLRSQRLGPRRGSSWWAIFINFLRSSRVAVLDYRHYAEQYMSHREWKSNILAKDLLTTRRVIPIRTVRLGKESDPLTVSMPPDGSAPIRQDASGCRGCGRQLVGRQRLWCSDACRRRRRTPRSQAHG